MSLLVVIGGSPSPAAHSPGGSGRSMSGFFAESRAMIVLSGWLRVASDNRYAYLAESRAVVEAEAALAVLAVRCATERHASPPAEERQWWRAWCDQS
jgi:hypothetical protein